MLGVTGIRFQTRTNAAVMIKKVRNYLLETTVLVKMCEIYILLIYSYLLLTYMLIRVVLVLLRCKQR